MVQLDPGQVDVEHVLGVPLGLDGRVGQAPVVPQAPRRTATGWRGAGGDQRLCKRYGVLFELATMSVDHRKTKVRVAVR